MQTCNFTKLFVKSFCEIVEQIYSVVFFVEMIFTSFAIKVLLLVLVFEEDRLFETEKFRLQSLRTMTFPVSYHLIYWLYFLITLCCNPTGNGKMTHTHTHKYAQNFKM
jgi:hypothetical protein